MTCVVLAKLMLTPAVNVKKKKKTEILQMSSIVFLNTLQ